MLNHKATNTNEYDNDETGLVLFLFAYFFLFLSSFFMSFTT